MPTILSVNGVKTDFQKSFLTGNEYSISEAPGDGFTVTWDDGHTDNMSGNWTSTDPVYEELGTVLYRHNFERIFYYPNNTSSGWATVTVYSTLTSLSVSALYGSFLNGNKFLMLIAPVISAKGTCLSTQQGTYCYSSVSKNNRVPHDALINYASSASAHDFTWDWRNHRYVIYSGASNQQLIGYEVKNNFGDTVFRAVNTPPIITPNNGGCELTINFENGTNYFYGEIPCDAIIEIIDDCECPELILLANQILEKL